MNEMTVRIFSAVCFIVLAPFIGGIMEGIDRKLSARMQGRKGPSVLQPFYDVSKLFRKEFLAVNRFQLMLILSYMFFVLMTGALLFAGCDLLMCFFASSTASMFLILASTSTHSEFASIGSSREITQMMCCEPMELLAAVGLYLASGSFGVADIIKEDRPAIILAPGIFVGFVFILTIKFRKSPFDIATSHHAHQEVVKGVTQEMVGIEYGITCLTEWYENVFLMSVVALFFITSNPISWIFAILAVAIVFFIEVLIDNTSARVKWQLMVKLAWGVTAIAGGLNILVLEVTKNM